MLLRLLALLVTMNCASLCPGQPLGPCEPATGCYIGAYIEMDPVAKDDIATFERLTGKKHASYFRYVGYGQPFPFEWAKRVREAGAAPHIAWEPNQGLNAVQDDEYLAGWIQACSHYGGPIFLRFASEMNGDWEAWSGNPDVYIRKWRMVYEAFSSRAPNVVFIWCPFATPKSTIPLYYPGDDYVDWVGVNVYSVVHHSGDVTKRAVDNAVQHLEFMYRLYADRKPLAVCEYAATHYCEASAAATVDFAVREMRRMYESIETRFPRVRMINWFSVDAVQEGLAHNDYALTTRDEVLQAYSATVAPPYFLSTVDGSPGGPSIAMPATAGAPAAQSGPSPLTPWGVPSPGAPGAGGFPGAVSTQPTVKTSAPLARTGHASPPPQGIELVVLGGDPAALTGNVRVEAVVGDAVRPDRVTFEMDGRFRAACTLPAYFFPWDASRATPGEHIIRAVAKSSGGAVLAETKAAVIVAPR